MHKMKKLNEMTIEEKIYQTAVYKLKDLKRMGIDNVGGIYVGGEVIEHDAQSGERIKRELEKISEVYEIPPIICGDFENGCGNALEEFDELPHLMALGASYSEELAYEYGKRIAIETGSMGINMTFSPVVDLNLNPQNTIVSNRSIGDNPDVTIPMLKALTKGMADNGLLYCLKHFPGDGVDYRNQHIVTTKNSLTYDDWKNTYEKVFKALIESGADSVMIGHICCPCIQKPLESGEYLPGTLSEDILNYLKDKMRFKGVCISDALSMGGFLTWYSNREQAQIECFKAGIDLMLWPDETYIEAMKKAVESGYISMDRLDDAVSRILALKEKMCLYEKNRNLKDKTKESNFADLLAEKSITLEKGKNFVPICENDSVAVFNIKGSQNSDKRIKYFVSCMERYCGSVDYYGEYYLNEVKNADKYDRIIYVTDTMEYSFPEIWASLCYNREKSIVLSFKSPYYKEYFERAEFVINAYSDSKASQRAAAKALAGKFKMIGKSPVKI